MGDIFRRETAKHPEPFTGERLTSSISGQVQIEHYHRYLLARSLVPGRTVLDVASGEGYGSALLAQVARSVIGIEHAGSAVQAARANFRRPNLQFLQGDARALPLADGCIDAAVSFETIEHFDRHDDFLREIRRVLSDDGCFIVSTPDRDIYSPAGIAANPFHVRELSRAEFTALLFGHFRCVRVLLQRPLIGSALLPDTASPAPPLVFDRRGDSHFEACIGMPRAPYLVGVASNAPLPPLPPSLYIDRSDLDTDAQRHADLSEQTRRLRTELERAVEQAQRAESDAAQACDRAARETADAITRAEDAAQARQLAVEMAAQAELDRRDAEQAAQDAIRQAAAAQARAQQAEAHAQQAEAHAQQAEESLQALQYEHARLQGSARSFLRGYLPRLRRHLFG